MSTSEEQTPSNDQQQSSGRTRRSAAVKSKKAWGSLMPHKKGEVDEDIAQESPKQTPTAPIPVETVSQKRARVVGGKGGRFKHSNVSKADASAAEVKRSSTVNGSPAKAIQSPSTPKKTNTTATPVSPIRSPARPAPHSKQPSKPTSAGSFRSPTQGLISSGLGSAAMNKEQLQEIEREVDKHLQGEMEYNEEEDEDEGTTKFVLDDPNDEDFCLTTKKAAKKSSRGGEEDGNPRGGRGKGRGGKPTGPARISSGIMRGRGGHANMGSSGSAVGPAIIMKSSVNSSTILNGGGAGSPNAFSLHDRRDHIVDQTDRRNLKVVRIRPGPQNPLNRNVAYKPAVPLSSLASSLSREISDISEKYRDRVIPGTTVQQFNNIIDQITQELNRVIGEQANNRQYMEQLTLTHTTQMELKDEKIAQLERTIEALQSKILVSFKRNQLNALKHETVGSGAVKKNEENGDAQSTSQSTKNVSPVGRPGNKVKLLRSYEEDEFEPSYKMPRGDGTYHDSDEDQSDDEEDAEMQDGNRQVTL